jgi:hypothetical protein
MKKGCLQQNGLLKTIKRVPCFPQNSDGFRLLFRFQKVDDQKKRKVQLRPGKCLRKHDGQPVMLDEYISLVGESCITL